MELRGQKHRKDKGSDYRWETGRRGARVIKTIEDQGKTRTRSKPDVDTTEN